jgi:hypothetical protein
LNPWEKGILCLTTGLTAAVLVRLWLSGLVGIYRLLFLYLASDFLSSAVALSPRYDTNRYAYTYAIVQTVKFAMAAFVLVEIYSLALENNLFLLLSTLKARPGQDCFETF